MLAEDPRSPVLAGRRLRQSRPARDESPVHQRAWFAVMLAAAAVGIVGTGLAAVSAFGPRPAGVGAGRHGDQVAALGLGARTEVADVGEIGETFAYANGVSVTVKGLRRARASGVAVGARKGQPIAVADIEVVNHSRGILNLTELQVSGRVRSRSGGRDRQADEVTDPAGVPKRLHGELPPGHHATGSYAFALGTAAEARAVAIELSPGYAYRWATFEGAAR